MPMPFASPLRLTDEERQGLASLARAHSTPQALAFRCRLILRVATPEAPTNLRVAADMHCHRQTVSLWRTRYLEHGLAGLQDVPRPGRPRRFSPLGAHRCPVTRDEYTSAHYRPVTRWSLDDMAAVLRDHARARAMSRSTLWRVLDEADLKPHRCVYWLNSHDPGFAAKARAICTLYVNALRFFQQGRLVICVDEKTGMQILQRKYPTQPAQPGKPAKREQEYIRHGVRVLIASFVVPTGQVLWHLGPTRTSEDFAAHLADVHRQLSAMTRYDWVVDNLNTHWSLEVCRLVAEWCQLPFDPKTLRRGVQRRTFLSDPTHKHVFHFTPGIRLTRDTLLPQVLAARA